MSYEEVWEPSNSDITWTLNLILRIKEGGVWAVPVSMTTYTLHHSKKQAEKLALLEGMGGDTNNRIDKCFKKIGWEVIDHGKIPGNSGG